ncbi:MAG: hypothetical protein ACR652_19100 [Methylocystis sp.]|uniref:hypothetical protein n=1 Tax=Methylocystis sp. TaxID=1911079 RepID=UPI003DA4F2D6
MRKDDYLFHGSDIFAVVEHQKLQIKEAINALDINRVLSSSIEDLCGYFENTFRLETPELHEGEIVADQRETQVEVHDSFRYGHFDSGPLIMTGTAVELSVPFTGDAGLFRVKPSTWSSVLPRGEVKDGLLVLQIEGAQLNAEQVKNGLTQQLDAVKQHLNWLRSSIDPFNASIRQIAKGHLEQRRGKLLADQSLVAGLGFPLKKRADAPQTYVAPNVRRKIQPRLPPASTVPFKPEPVLDETEYANILGVITNMTHVMERSPSSFATMGEEDIRQHFLVQLNGQYEGQATGETFNYQGKTDILIRAEGRNIFIAECKFWRGEKSFAETLDQLLSYLSWRDTKTAVIIFNRNKGFTDVLEKIKAAALAHPQFKTGPKINSETQFRYVFGQKDDGSREVIVTVMAFDVPSTASHS